MRSRTQRCKESMPKIKSHSGCLSFPTSNLNISTLKNQVYDSSFINTVISVLLLFRKHYFQKACLVTKQIVDFLPTLPMEPLETTKKAVFWG